MEVTADQHLGQVMTLIGLVDQRGERMPTSFLLEGIATLSQEQIDKAIEPLSEMEILLGSVDIARRHAYDQAFGPPPEGTADKLDEWHIGLMDQMQGEEIRTLRELVWGKTMLNWCRPGEVEAKSNMITIEEGRRKNRPVAVFEGRKLPLGSTTPNHIKGTRRNLAGLIFLSGREPDDKVYANDLGDHISAMTGIRPTGANMNLFRKFLDEIDPDNPLVSHNKHGVVSYYGILRKFAVTDSGSGIINRILSGPSLSPDKQ